MRTISLATEWTTQGGEAKPVFGAWSPPEVFLSADREWMKGRLLGCFPDTVLRCGDRLRAYHHSYTAHDGDYNLEVAERIPDGAVRRHPLLRDRDGAFTLSGLPAHLMPIQPNVFLIAPGLWRMYFWAHHHAWEERTVRFLVAESADGMHWRLREGSEAVLYHYTDRLCREGAVPLRKQSNDATTVYRRPDGSWELYSAALWIVPEGGSTAGNRPVPAGALRFIQRWTSPDGLEFDDPRIVLLPDADDPFDLQFYSLAMHRMEDYRLGLIGRYRTAEQKLEVEPAYSFDGIRWVRPIRDRVLPTLPGTFSHTASHQLLEEGDQLRLFFDCDNFDHGFRTSDGSPPEIRICTTTIDRRRLFGVRCGDASLLSPPVRLVNASLVIHTAAGSDFWLAFHDLFGQPFPGSEPLCTGTAERNELPVPANLRGLPVRLHLRGRGVLYDTET